MITFSVSEAALRLFWLNPYAGSSADKILKLRVHHANMYQLLDRRLIDKDDPMVLYRTNKKSYIEPAFRFDNPDLTIAFLGGSTTECIAVKEEKRFPFLVSKLLEDKGLRVNSLNAARAGGTLHDSINVLLNHVLLDKPDIVVLMHAVNDIGVLKYDSDYKTRMGHDISILDIGKYSVQMASTKSSVFGMLRKVSTISADEFVRNDKIIYKNTRIVNIEQYRARIKIFIEICRAFGIKPIIMTQPLIGYLKNEITPEWTDLDTQDKFNQAIREIGTKTNTDVIDLTAYIVKNFSKDDEFKRIFYDGLHVTDYGSTVYATCIAEGIYKTLDINNPVKKKRK